MSHRFSRTLSFIAAAAAVLVVGSVVPAVADDVYNTLDASIDATAETLNLNTGGAAQTVTYKVEATNSDGKNGCNFQGSQTATFQVNVSAPARVTVSPSTLTFDSCSSNPTLTVTPGATAGSSTVSLTQLTNQTSGTFNVAPATFTAVVANNNVAPTVSAKAPNATGNEGQTLSTSGAFSDANGNNTVTVTQTAGVGSITTNGSGGWSWSHSPNDQGTGSVTIRATDSGGLSVTDTFTWTGSNVAPMIVSDAGNVTGTEGIGMSNSGSFADVSGDLPLTITQSAGPGTVTQGAGNTWSWSHTPADQTSGPVTISVQANDGDGGTTTDSFTFTAVNANPQIVIKAADPTVNEGQTASTNGAFGDVAADPLAITRVPLTGTLTSATTGTWSWSLLTQDQTSAAITVTANDGDGGSQVDVFSYTVLNVAPSVSVSPANASGVEGTELTSGGAFTDPGAANDPLTITKTAGDGTVTDNHDGTWAWAYTPADEGSGSVTVRADDGDGGTKTTTFNWSATNLNPVVQNAAADATGNEGDVLTTSGRFRDVPGDALTITRLSGDGTVTDNHDGTWNWSLATSDVENGTVVVQVADGDGGSTTDSFDFSASDVQTSVKNAAADAVGNEGDTLTTNGSFKGAAVDTLVVEQVSGAGTFVDNGAGLWSWSLSTSDDASGSVTVRVSDDDGNISEDTFTYTASDVRPNVVTNAGNVSDVEGATLSNSGSFTGAAADTITLTSADPNVVITGHSWSWSLVTDDEVSGSVSVLATDDDGNTVIDSFDYVALNVAPAVVNDAADQAGVEGQPMGTSGSFSDVAGDVPLNISKTSGPGTVTPNANGTGWSWSFTPDNQILVGETVTVTADDGDGGITTDTFELTAANADPTVTQPADDVTIDEGQTGGTAGAFGDVIADPLTITHSPSGVGTLTPNSSGAWSWSIYGLDDAEGDVTISADDSDSGSASDTFHYTVKNVAPSVDGVVSDVTGAEGTDLTNAGGFTDPGGASDPLTITGTGAGTVTDNNDGTWSWSYAAGDDGDGTVTVTADDGDDGTTTVTFDWTATNTPPTIPSEADDVSLPEGSTLIASGSFDDVPADVLTITSDAAGGELNISGRSWTWTHPTTGVESGTIYVTATDDDGDAVTDTFDYEATNVVPTVQTSAAPNPTVTTEGGTLHVTGSFTSAAVDTLKVTKSGAGTLADNGDGSWSWSLVTTDDGSGSVTVKVTDDDGTTAEDTFDWKATDVKPTVFTAAGNASDLESATLTASGSFDKAAVDTLTITSAGAGDLTVKPDGVSWSWSLVTDDEVSGSVSVSATDDDGNTVTDSFTYVASNVVPSVVVDAADQAGVEGQPMGTSGSFADVAGDVPLSISGDGPGTVTPNANGTGWSWSFTPADQILVGETVTVTADDGDGGITTDTFTVTAINADPTVTVPAPNVTIDEGQTGGTAGAFGDVVADPLVITHFPSGVGTLNPNSSGAWSWSIYGLDDAEGDITVTADDSDTGTASDTFHYTVNNVAPSVDGVVSDVTGAEGTELTNTGGFTDPGDDHLTITGTGAGDVTDNGDDTWNWSHTPGDNGNGTVTVTANDGDGGITTVTFDWTATNTPPTIQTAAHDATGPEGSTLMTEGVFTDVPADTIAVTLEPGDGGTVTDLGGGSWKWTLDTNDNVSGTVTVIATDDDGDSVTDTFDYASTNVAPTVITDATDSSGDEGVLQARSGSFSDVTGDLPIASITKTTGPGSLSRIGDGDWAWSFTPGDELASTLVTITATDKDGASVEDTFVVSATNVRPMVSQAAADVVTSEGQIGQTIGAFADVDTVSLTHAGKGSVSPAGSNGWAWSYQTTDDETGNVTVTADDGDGGQANDDFDFTVNNVNPSSSGSVSNPSGFEGSQLQTNGSFTDPGTDPLTITKDSGAGTVTDLGGGSWKWTNTPNDNGSGSVTVKATDDDGGTGFVTFTWTASNVAPTLSALTMTGASGTACLTGNTVGVSFSVSDPSLADTMSGIVAWGDGATTSFSGRTPSLSHSYAPGTYTVTVNASDDDGGAATPRTASVSRTYVLSAFQPPINNDNSSVFKAGSTIPVKIKVTDCSGASVPNVAPTIATKLSSAGTPPVDINETIASTSAADTTGIMRYTDGQYIYNLNTKLMADPNATYWIEVRLGTVAQQVKIGLRSK